MLNYYFSSMDFLNTSVSQFEYHLLSNSRRINCLVHQSCFCSWFLLCSSRAVPIRPGEFGIYRQSSGGWYFISVEQLLCSARFRRMQMYSRLPELETTSHPPSPCCATCLSDRGGFPEQLSGGSGQAISRRARQYTRTTCVGMCPRRLDRRPILPAHRHPNLLTSCHGDFSIILQSGCLFLDYFVTHVFSQMTSVV